jgi:Caspase domain/Ankyrin repeats (3 copies)
LKKIIPLSLLCIAILLSLSCVTPDANKTEDVNKIEDEDIGRLDPLTLIESGDTVALVQALSDGTLDISWTDEDGAGYLHHAAWHGRTDIVEALLASGADVNARRKDEYTPLHWAVYNNHPDVVKVLIDKGATIDIVANGTTPLMWAAAKGYDEIGLMLLEQGASIEFGSDLFLSAVTSYNSRFGDHFESNYKVYKNSLLAALAEDTEAMTQGSPSLPPRADAELSFDGSYHFTDTAPIHITVNNSGKGDLYQLTADVIIDKSYPVYFGRIAPGQTITRTLSYDGLTLKDCGKDLPVTIRFKEANDYAPEALKGKISIDIPDNNYVAENLPSMTLTEIKGCLDRDYFSQNDLNRAVIVRASDLSMNQIHDMVNAGLIDRIAIDKLIRFEKMNYTIDDLVFFAQSKAISQENLELVLLEKRVPYSADHILSIARSNYISRQVVEALYLDKLTFSSTQVKELIDLKVFSLPEILFTYTINDGDSSNSVGNKDGMIQIKEGPDFDFIIKNNSVFELSNLKIKLTSTERYIDLFNNKKELKQLGGGETTDASSTIAVKPAFGGDSFDLAIVIEDDYYGTLIDEMINIPVGRVVGSKVLTLNKKIVADKNIVARSGASSESSKVVSISEGAVFDAVGELGDWYKVGIFGQYAWVPKNEVSDATQQQDSSYLAENRSDFAKGEESEGYSERLFVNSRPTLIIASPKNNDQVYNRTTMDIIAEDLSFGITSIDIKINGKSLDGSGTRGLRVRNEQGNEYRKTYSLQLNKGENQIAITAYNSKNVASDTKELILWSQGVQNPPSLYALAIGVSEYEIESQNLDYAASDAEKIATALKRQINSDIYENVEVKTLLNEEATRSNIKDQINTFLSKARSDDMAILFFAGHGITDSRGRYYFIGHDGDMNNPSANGIKQSDFEDDLVAAIQARKVVVMLDSCQSGTATAGRRGNDDITAVVDNLSQATGFTIMSASRGNEYAYEGSEWNGGAFTQAIKEALDGKGDNGDGYVDVNELDSYVYNRVIELTDSKQHPTSKRESSESYRFYQIH